MKSSSSQKRAAVFLDRDDTINIDYGYVFEKEKLVFMPGAVEAIKKLNDAGFLIFVVTNQSAVARGYCSEQEVVAFHEHMEKQLQTTGASVDAYYFCPHHPDFGDEKYRRYCKCRKPENGMFDMAVNDFEFDVERSWMVGDKIRDIQFGIKSGLRTILIGNEHHENLISDFFQPSLLKAAEVILRNS